MWRLAREFGINAKQVGRWLREHGHGGRARKAVASEEPAPARFVAVSLPPVLPIAAADDERVAVMDVQAPPSQTSHCSSCRSLQRPLFAAKSQARGTDQKDLLLNEAEVLAPTHQTPPAQNDEEESTLVAGHQRKKRGGKPLDPALPREIMRHELPEAERVCAHDGHALVEIGAPRSASRCMSSPSRYVCCSITASSTPAPAAISSLKVASTPTRIIARGLKQFRAIATRYDKTATNFLGAIHLAASVVWLN